MGQKWKIFLRENVCIFVEIGNDDKWKLFGIEEHFIIGELGTHMLRLHFEAEN